MSKLFTKKLFALLTLSLFALSSVSPIIPYGPKVPPVELME